MYLDEILEDAAISVITRAEVLTGFTADTREQIIEFLDLFILLEINKPIADLSATLRRQYGWKLPDALQAAVAKYYGLQLATRNTKDFSPMKYDFVTIPYEIREKSI